MNDFECGWLSALIDGEGSLNLVANGKTKAGNHTHFEPDLQIKNNNKELLEKAQGIIGSGRIYKRKWKKPEWADSYEYHLNSMQDVARILKEIAPFLIVKKQKAYAMLKWLNSRMSRINHNHNRITEYTDEELEQMKFFRSCIRHLSDVKLTGEKIETGNTRFPILADLSSSNSAARANGISDSDTTNPISHNR